MKKILLMTFVAVGMFMLAGCEIESKSQETVVGTWDVIPMESYVYSVYEGDTAKMFINTPIRMNFKEGGELIISKDDESTTHTWHTDGPCLTIDDASGYVMSFGFMSMTCYVEKEVVEDGMRYILGEYYSLKSAF